MLVVGRDAAIGWGLVTNTSAGWLDWQGYLLEPLGLGGKDGAWAYAGLGVLVALVLGFAGTSWCSWARAGAGARGTPLAPLHRGPPTIPLMSDLSAAPAPRPAAAASSAPTGWSRSAAAPPLVAVVGLILSIAGIIGSGLWVIAAIVAAVCALLFWRTVSK